MMNLLEKAANGSHLVLMKKTLKIFAAILFGAKLAGESQKYAIDRQYFMLEIIFVSSILTFFTLMVYLLF